MFDPASGRAAALMAVRGAFERAGLEEPALDARLLLAAALDVRPLDLLLAPGMPLDLDGARRLEALVGRRLAREPVARILGLREFWGLPFALSPGTLEPRPDTETVVDAALAALPAREQPARVLDLGTGTGCLLLAILSERPLATGIGIDRAPDAVRTARSNAARNGLSARAGFLCGDWAAAVAGPFDLVVSNPPYIPAADIATLAPEVRRFDPAAALDGGPDGLDAYRSILRDLRRLLAPDGAAVLEIGHDQASALTGLAPGAGARVDGVRKDLGGRDRAVTLRLEPGLAPGRDFTT